MTEFCKVSPASRDDGHYQIAAKIVVLFFTELLFVLSSSKPPEERLKKNPFWFIVVYTEITAGLEKSLSYVFRARKAVLIKHSQVGGHQGVGDIKMTNVFVGSVIL